MGEDVPALKSDSIRPSGLYWLTLLLAIVAATLMNPGANAATSPFLTQQEVDSDDISAFTKWTGVMPRYELQRVEASDRCIGDACLNKQWEALLVRLKGTSLNRKIVAVNDFFNAIPYVSDLDNYGVTDLWQTPYELMEKGGDCEDYAIAKYISLRRLGVPESDMRIIVVRDADLGGVVHAVLEVRDGNRAKVLDNQNARIIPTKQIHHYSPLFAINEHKWWSYDTPPSR